MEFARSEEELSRDSLALVEANMNLEEEVGIEISEEDWESSGGDWFNWGDGGWLNGAPVPRIGPKPTLPGAAEAEIPPPEATDGDDHTL